MVLGVPTLRPPDLPRGSLVFSMVGFWVVERIYKETKQGRTTLLEKGFFWFVFNFGTFWDRGGGSSGIMMDHAWIDDDHHQDSS